jgi:type IX secretion system PorP/SprF family membrane protein
MRKGLLLGLISFSILSVVGAQDVPLYNNFHNNPYFYNPSFAGAKRKSEVTLLYRQQWTGLQDAPKFTNLTFTAPLRNLGFGVNIQNTSRGIIITSSALASLSYRVPFSKNSSLSFGLSAGAGRNTLDMSQVDPNDPVVSKVLNNNYFFEGQAGFHFRYNELIVGFSMPYLFDRNIIDTQSQQPINFNPLRTTISSIRYKINVSQSISFEPIVLVKMSQTATRIEGYGTFQYKSIIWLGGLYRQNFGASALAGFRINDFLRLGYAYEFATNDISEFNFNTHEFTISLQSGKGAAAPEPRKQRKNYNIRPDFKKTNHYRKTHHDY